MNHGFYKELTDNTDNNIHSIMFLEHQISISEWFQKGHVTLKTGVIAAENSALTSQEKIIF